jgi:hypothetical protein
VVEERKGTAITLPKDYTEIDRRSWSDTQVLFARRRQAPTAERPG